MGLTLQACPCLRYTSFRHDYFQSTLCSHSLRIFTPALDPPLLLEVNVGRVLTEPTELTTSVVTCSTISMQSLLCQGHPSLTTSYLYFPVSINGKSLIDKSLTWGSALKRVQISPAGILMVKASMRSAYPDKNRAYEHLRVAF